MLGRVIQLVGPQYSRLTPQMCKLYLCSWVSNRDTKVFIHSLLDAIIFVTGDIISLVVQGIGGGVASSASTHSGAVNGGHIMLGGIIFQLSEYYSYSHCNFP